jgi:hypothetical protein
MLEDLGCVVVTAACGAEALKTLSEDVSIRLVFVSRARGDFNVAAAKGPMFHVNFRSICCGHCSSGRGSLRRVVVLTYPGSLDRLNPPEAL